MGNDIIAQLDKIQELFPDPNILRAYSEIDPSFPERIMKMTEANNRNEIRQGLMGQIFSFILGLAGLGASVFLAMEGLTAGAITAALGGISPIILAIIAGFRKSS